MAKNTAGKKIIVALIATFFVYVFQTVDMFFIHHQNSIFVGNVVGRIAGIVVFIIASIFIRFNVRNFCFRSYNWVGEVFIGAMYAVIPAAICFGAEYLFFRFVRGYNDLVLYVDFPNVNDGMDFKMKLIFIGLYVFSIMLESLFKELFFRGYLITQFFGKLKMKKSILLQAFLYMLLLVPTIVNYVLIGRFTGYGIPMAAFIIGTNLFVDFVSGIKWGLFYKVNGTVWMSVSDHFFNNIILTCVFVTYGMMPMKWYMLQAVAVMLISFFMFVPLYFRRDKRNEEIAAEVAIRRELAGMPVDNYSPSPVRRFIETKRYDRQVEFARKNNLPIPKKPIKYPADLEEAVSLEDSGVFGEEIVAQSMKTFEIADSDGNKEEAEPIHASPSELSKAYFEDKTKGAMRTDVDITADMSDADAKETESISDVPQAKKAGADDDSDSEGESENSTNISNLVKGYFEENFNKHTF